MREQSGLNQDGIPKVIDDGILKVIDNFADPHQEWRRLIAEFVGTFFLVLVAAGAPMVARQHPGTIAWPLP